MKKYLKILLALLSVLFATIYAANWYEEYSQNKAEMADLLFETSRKWEWHDKINRIQINYDSDSKRSILRKVYPEKKYSIYAKKNDDMTISAAVFFHYRCIPGDKIITSKTFSSGKVIELICTEDGSALVHSAVWNNTNPKFIWEGNLDGYRFYEDFSSWDFSKLDKEIAQSKEK